MSTVCVFVILAAAFLGLPGTASGHPTFGKGECLLLPKSVLTKEHRAAIDKFRGEIRELMANLLPSSVQYDGLVETVVRGRGFQYFEYYEDEEFYFFIVARPGMVRGRLQNLADSVIVQKRTRLWGYHLSLLLKNTY